MPGFLGNEPLEVSAKASTMIDEFHYFFLDLSPPHVQHYVTRIAVEMHSSFNK
jgi:hypothetical protein